MDSIGVQRSDLAADLLVRRVQPATQWRRKAAATSKKNAYPAFGVGPVLLSKHGRQRNFSRHPIGPPGLGLSVALSAPGSENTKILSHWMNRGKRGFERGKGRRRAGAKSHLRLFAKKA